MVNLWIIYRYGWWETPTPLKNMSLSIGMMTFPTEWENKKCSKPPTSDYIADMVHMYGM